MNYTFNGEAGERTTKQAKLIHIIDAETVGILEKETMAYEVDHAPGYFFAKHTSVGGHDIKVFARLYDPMIDPVLDEEWINVFDTDKGQDPVLVAINDDDAEEIMETEEAYEELAERHKLNEKYTAIAQLRTDNKDFDAAVKELKKRNVEEWEGDEQCYQDDLFDLFDNWDARKNHFKSAHA